MGYSADILLERVEILKRVQTNGKMGKNSGAWGFVRQACVHASVTFKKGIKAMTEDSFDNTDFVLIRMRYNNFVNRNSYIYHDNIMYMVTECHKNRHENIAQLKAQEVNADYTIVEE